MNLKIDRTRFYVLVILLLSACKTLCAETVWVEAETASPTSMQVESAIPSILSAGKWLHGTSGDAVSADVPVTVADGGRYAFMVRKLEPGGFRWKFDDQTWVSVEDVTQYVLDEAPSKYGAVSWINLGYATLAAGAHTLHLETIVPGAGKPNHGYSFDCFALSNDGFVPKGIDHNGGVRIAPIKIDESDFGKLMPRTMSLLESATPTHHTPVYILCYGQSIIGICHIDTAIQKFLQAKYPNADIRMKNLAIGGYQAPILRKTAWQDMYPENPDLLIFHDYGGENGELEEIFRGIRSNMTCDVLTWTHHVDAFNCNIQKQTDAMCVIIRNLTAKYGFELADVRVLWKDDLMTNHLPPGSMLADMIHLNGNGTNLITSFLTPHFRDNPDASVKWQKRIHTIALDQPSDAVTFDSQDWTRSADGVTSTGTASLKLKFTGNRVDLVSLQGSRGSAKILLDGKAPSKIADTLAATRSTSTPGTWWPAISRIILGAGAVVEHWTMNFHDVSPDGKTYAFDLVGSVSGSQGSGKSGADFTSADGSIAIKADDYGWDGKKPPGKPFPPAFAITWDVYSMSQDASKSPEKLAAGAVPQSTIIRCWSDGAHEVEIVPNGDGAIGLKELIVFSPKGN